MQAVSEVVPAVVAFDQTLVHEFKINAVAMMVHHVVQHQNAIGLPYVNSIPGAGFILFVAYDGISDEETI